MSRIRKNKVKGINTKMYFLPQRSWVFDLRVMVKSQNGFIFWDVGMYNPIGEIWSFKRISCHRLQGGRVKEETYQNYVGDTRRELLGCSLRNGNNGKPVMYAALHTETPYVHPTWKKMEIWAQKFRFLIIYFLHMNLWWNIWQFFRHLVTVAIGMLWMNHLYASPNKRI
jgi:hypothetical protein